MWPRHQSRHSNNMKQADELVPGDKVEYGLGSKDYMTILWGACYLTDCTLYELKDEKTGVIEAHEYPNTWQVFTR